MCFPQSVSLLAGGSSSSSNTLTERLLRQNAELTGFVSRLTEEKNDLRNHTLRLEDELRCYRQAGQGSGDSVSTCGVGQSCCVTEVWQQNYKINILNMLLTKFFCFISSCSSAGEECRRRIRQVCCFPRRGRPGQERRSAWRKLYIWPRLRWPDSGGRSGATPCGR